MVPISCLQPGHDCGNICFVFIRRGHHHVIGSISGNCPPSRVNYVTRVRRVHLRLAGYLGNEFLQADEDTLKFLFSEEDLSSHVKGIVLKAPFSPLSGAKLKACSPGSIRTFCLTHLQSLTCPTRPKHQRTGHVLNPIRLRAVLHPCQVLLFILVALQSY